MPPYDIFFFSAFFFLFGVLCASAGLKSGILLIVVMSEIILLLWWYYSARLSFLKNWSRKKLVMLMILTPCILLGALYFTHDDIRLKSVPILFDKKIETTGIIKNVPVRKEEVQEFILGTKNPSYRILVRAPASPEWHYGDKVTIQGIIRHPNPEGYAQYLLKERVRGIVAFPQISLISLHEASKIRETLFNVRESIVGAFQKLLPSEESAFLSGLTLGVRSEFSKEFKDAMQKSGTTHMVALSGYNITIVVWMVMGLLLMICSRRTAFILALIFVIAFVLMAGGEASVVRAAVMGMLILLARETGRVYDLRNAVICAGLIMVLVNPKVLVFDVGFQLSFLALLGIVYLRPALMKLFRTEDTTSLFSWKDNLITTSAAQFAVLPIIMNQFGSMSVTSILANIIILETIPIAMALGLGVALLAFLWRPSAIVIGWFTWVVLAFEVGAIKFFARFAIPLHFTFSVPFMVIYYTLLIFVIVRAQKI